MSHLSTSIAGRIRYRATRNKTLRPFVDRYDLWRVSSPTRRARRSFNGTALHAAVARCDVHEAAQLLRNGTDYSLPDGQGLPALSRRFARPQLVHAIRQRYLFPSDNIRTDSQHLSPEIAGPLAELTERGITKIPGLVDSATLARLREDFEAVIAAIDADLKVGKGLYLRYHEEHHYSPDKQFYECNNAFKYSDHLVRLACGPFLLELAGRYTGRPVHVQRAQAMRYAAGVESEGDQFTWHHDRDGRQMKVMILLTDITPRDHTMVFATKSHRIDHPLSRFEDNRLSRRYIARHVKDSEDVHTIGRAGDGFLFDANGAHRANRRRTGSMRDVFMLEYNSDPSNVSGGTVNASALSGLSESGIASLKTLRTCPPRWGPDSWGDVPTWTHTLYRTGSWCPPKQ